MTNTTLTSTTILIHDVSHLFREIDTEYDVARYDAARRNFEAQLTAAIRAEFPDAQIIIGAPVVPGSIVDAFVDGVRSDDVAEDVFTIYQHVYTNGAYWPEA